MPWNDVLVVLALHPVPQRAEVVAEVELAGWLHAGQDACHAAQRYRRVARGALDGSQVADREPVVRPELVEDDTAGSAAPSCPARSVATAVRRLVRRRGRGLGGRVGEEVRDLPAPVRARRATVSSNVGDASMSMPIVAGAVHELEDQSGRVIRQRRTEHGPGQPRIDDEDEVPQGLGDRPLAADLLVLLLGCEDGRSVDGRLPRGHERAHAARRSAGSSDRISTPFRVQAIQLGLDKRHHVDTVHRQVLDVAVDLGVDHLDADRRTPFSRDSRIVVPAKSLNSKC